MTLGDLHGEVLEIIQVFCLALEGLRLLHQLYQLSMRPASCFVRECDFLLLKSYVATTFSLPGETQPRYSGVT
jgi:hypothetical protein